MTDDRAKHILIADDEAPIRFALGMALRRAGYRTSEAKDGAEALVKILADGLPAVPFDLIILDIHMPYLTGIRVFEILMEQGVSVPVLFVAAFVEQGEIESAVRRCPCNLLLKPFGHEQMLSVVSAMI